MRIPIGKILGVVFFGFLLRLIFWCLNSFFFTLPNGGNDALTFEENAYWMYQSEYRELILVKLFTSGARLLEFLGSLVYYIFGREPLVLSFIMVLLGTYLVVLTYKATYLLWQKHKVAKKAAIFIAVFPNLMLHSALFLREVPVNIFIMLAIISFIKFWKYKMKRKIIPFLIFTFIAILFHSGSLAILIGFLYFIIFLSKKANIKIRLAAIVFIIPILYLLNSTGLGLSKFGGSIDGSLELLKQRESYELKGGSSYPSWMMMTGGVNDIWKIPVRFIAFIFSPLVPFLVNSTWHSIGLLDSLFYVSFFYVFYKKRYLLNENTTAKGIFFMMFFTIFIFSLGVSNVGTAIRHRAKIVPVLIMLSVGMKDSNSCKHNSIIKKNKI